MLGLMLLVFSFSCSPQGDSNDPFEKLTAYCIRECVIETSDSEICDTQCKCASEKLSNEYSKEEFVNLVQAITQNNTANLDSVQKLRNALDLCKDRSK
jgi:hypothetical protein